MPIERATERKRYIIDKVKEGDVVHIENVSNKFDCSPYTIKNDLRQLRAIGVDVQTKKGYIKLKDTIRPNIVREIEFPHGYKEAATSILSYFSRILEIKYPNTDATVTLSQCANSVIMKVESDEKELENIEQTLEDYGRVIKGHIDTTELLPNSMDALELQNKLELARTELKLKEQTFDAVKSEQSKRIDQLESQVDQLNAIIGKQLTTIQNLSTLFNSNFNKDIYPQKIGDALEKISALLESNYSIQNEAKFREALSTLQSENETLFYKVKQWLQSASSSISVDLASSWIIKIINSLPK